MSYLALARKYRPRRFADVRGQDHVVRALTHALDHDRLHPALLLTGTRGVGKTSLARIIAKALNCEIGVTATPCGVCSACCEVDGGRFIDLIEIDAASRTKVDDTRQLLDNVAYAPVRGRYKVYLIDEVHMLSNASFNALLKTLEEPPPHVKFILATTDPQKLPVTVLSRCLQFNLKRLPATLIREVLGDVLSAEGLDADAAALAAIARAADGSMRDGLSLLDQAIAYCGGGRLESEAIESMLGMVGRRTLLELLAALAAGDRAALISGLRALDASAPDYAAMIDTLAALLQRIAVLQILPEVADETDDPELPVLAGRISAEDAQLYYQIAVHGRRDLPWAPDPRLGFEMTILRMFAFRPQDDEPKPNVAAPSAGERARRSPPATDTPRPATAITPEPPQGIAEPAAPVAAAVGGAAEQWTAWIERSPLDGMTRQLALHCAPIMFGPDRVRLVLEERFKHLLVEGRRIEIEQALAADIPGARSVEIEIAESVTDSPVRLEQTRITERQQAAEAAIAEDPAVQLLVETLGARVRPDSVQPVDQSRQATDGDDG